MNWLVGSVLASMLLAVAVVRVFDYVFSGVTGGVASAVRNGMFVGVWTWVAAHSGMREVGQRIRKLRQRNRVVSGLIDIGSKDKPGGFQS